MKERMPERITLSANLESATILADTLDREIFSILVALTLIMLRMLLGLHCSQRLIIKLSDPCRGTFLERELVNA